MSEYSLTDIRGVGLKLAEKLRRSGVYTVEALAITPPRILAEALDWPEEKALKLSRDARETLGINFVTAEECYRERQRINYVSTGCKALDDVLDGGVESRAVTELAGEFGTGKTQLCHQLAVMVQLSREEGGLGAKALYVDSEGTFRPERIVQMAEHRGVDPKRILKNIIYARAYNSDHQMLLIDEASRILGEEGVKMILVDSLVGHFRAEYPGRELLVMRQQKLNRHVHQLVRMADAYNVAVVVTNQVLATPDVYFGNPLRPAGGNIVAHGCTYRVWFRKGAEGKRIARVFDSPRHPEIEAAFVIAVEGIVDV